MDKRCGGGTETANLLDMSFLGPDVKLKPGWKQGWWWRERVPTIVAVIVLAVGIGLAGWLPFYLNDNDDSPARPRDTASGEPTTATPPRPTEKPPELPDEVSEPTREGVEATARYETDAINYGQRTGDVTPLKQVYDLELCAVCRGLLDDVEDATVNGSYLEGGAYTVVSATGGAVYAGSEGRPRGRIEIRIKRNAGRHLTADGRVVREIAADPPSLFELELSFDNGAWKIHGGSLKERG